MWLSASPMFRGVQLNAEEEYGSNIGRFIKDHPKWVVAAGFEGVGFRARPKAGEGSWVSAWTLDELAAKLAEGSS